MGLEAEVGGRRLGGEDGAGVQDDEAAIEQFPELDATAGVGALVGAGRELEPAGPEVDRVVAGDPARIATAEHEGEVARGAAPGGRRLRRGPGEARIKVTQELGQKGIGGVRGGDVAQAEFAGEAILQGAPEALDAAFGLGGARRDIAKPVVPKVCLSKVCR